MLTRHDIDRMVAETLIPDEAQDGTNPQLCDPNGILTYSWGWTVNIINPERAARNGWITSFLSYAIEKETGKIMRKYNFNDLDLEQFLVSLGRHVTVEDFEPFDLIEDDEDVEL